MYSSVSPNSVFNTIWPQTSSLPFLLVTLPELDKEIFAIQRLLELSPRSDPNRSDPNRSTLLVILAALRSRLFRVSEAPQKSDLDKAITHLTEAVILPPTQHWDIFYVLNYLANVLLSRYEIYQQPDDVKYSIKYFRFLRINFHLPEACPEPTSGNITTQLFHALAYNLAETPCDMVQDLEEMVALILKFITGTTNVLTSHEKLSIKALGEAIARTEMFCPEDTHQVTNRAIQVLRDATVLNPDFDISYALAQCLEARFETTLIIDDCEEAIAIADRIVGTHAPGDIVTTVQTNAMRMSVGLLVSRLSSFSRPEYLVDAIHRIRTFLPRLPDEDRTVLAKVLTTLTRQRFKFFGVTGNPGGIVPNPDIFGNLCLRHILFVGQESEPMLQYDDENLLNFTNVTTAIYNGEITDVEAAVERTRKLLPLQQSRGQLSNTVFADMLFQAYFRTKRLDYLEE